MPTLPTHASTTAPAPGPRGRRTGGRRLLAAALGVLLAALVTAPVGQAADAHRKKHAKPDTYVAAWDAIGSQAFTAAALSPAEGHVLFDYSSLAVYDAVVAVKGRYEPFAVRDNAPRGASAEAAVVAAAHRIYEHFLPAQEAPILDPAYDASLATIPDGPRKDAGVAVGLRVANAHIALRADDGFRADVGYTPPSPVGPGDWVPTAPVPPVGAYMIDMRPFALDSPDQFRPDGPPSLTSKRWARDFNEVKRFGSATSTVRTPQQTTAALFWAEAPVQQSRAAMRGVITQHRLDVVQAARMMAMTGLAYADSMIACFDAKYTSEFWRPITAVRAGDTDGNPRTTGDPAWTPMLPGTPNHPEYPSAHSCLTPAAGLALATFLGTHRIHLTVPSLTGLGDRHFATVKDLTREVANARVWGGIHFRSAVDDGSRLAGKVAREVLDGNFGKLRR